MVEIVHVLRQNLLTICLFLPHNCHNHLPFLLHKQWNATLPIPTTSLCTSQEIKICKWHYNLVLILIIIFYKKFRLFHLKTILPIFWTNLQPSHIPYSIVDISKVDHKHLHIKESNYTWNNVDISGETKIKTLMI